MSFIDSHCHLHDTRILGDIPGILSRAAAAGVTHMVTCATMEDNFDETARLADTYPSVLPCYGIHPWFLDSLSDHWRRVLADRVAGSRSGIGETGLDFMIPGADRDRQIEVFSFHLDLARELARPINIHVRKAWDALIHILKRTGPLEAPGLIHSFSGSADMVRLLERYNLYISFSGSVTRPNAKKVVRALNAVSEDRLLLETDTPDIFPSFPGRPARGLNEPGYLAFIAETAAARAGRDVAEFIHKAHDNGLRVFAPILPGENT